MAKVCPMAETTIAEISSIIKKLHALAPGVEEVAFPYTARQVSAQSI